MSDHEQRVPPGAARPQETAADPGRREALKGLAALAALPLFPDPFVPRQNRRGAVDPGMRDQSFDDGWRFLRGDAAGADRPAFDDTGWRALDVPHDWSLDDLPAHPASTGEAALWTGAGVPDRIGPFDVNDSQGQTATGFVVGGTGWYRKRFSAADLPADRQVELRFDGVYMDTDVWLNGEHLGNHPYGYTGFLFDLTPHLRRDAPNVLAVRVRNTGKNSRWYSGSGIYRHVWLTVTGPVRIATWGLDVSVGPVSPGAASVQVGVAIDNRGSAAPPLVAHVTVVDPAGATVGQQDAPVTVAAGAAGQATATLNLPSPARWSIDAPRLYRAEVELRSGGTTLDRAATPFGVRTIEVDAARGLRLNGESVLLKGGCLHHDNGVLGAAAIDRAEERRVEVMKANGFNAIRTSHNPPSPAFLDACDRVGMLVIDEAFDMWHEGNKNPQDYHRFFDDWWERDLRTMVVRDRNHPSVVFWSIGNEIHERAEPAGVAIAGRLIAAIKDLDTSRPITMAVCGFWDYPNRPWVETDPAFRHLDVGGYNYQWKQYVPDHARHPDRIMMGTESYPLEAFENWQAVEANAWVLGDFVWTGMDYLGETGIAHSHLDKKSDYELQPFPWFGAYCGDVDLIGGKKPQSWYRDVVWRRSPIEMAVQRPIPEGHTEAVSAWGWSDELRSWTWPGAEGRPLKVRVYTRGDTVRLLLDDREVGSKAVSDDTKLTAEFSVPYAPGRLRAVALRHGAEIGSVTFETVGPPARLRLSADRPAIRASRDDLAYVTVDVLDAQNRLVPDATVPVAFTLSGAADLAGVGSASPKDPGSFHAPRCRTFHGHALAVVRPTGARGSATLRVEAAGLASATVTIRMA